MRKILLIGTEENEKSVIYIYKTLDKNLYQIESIKYINKKYYTNSNIEIDNIEKLIKKQNIIFDITNKETVRELLKKIDIIHITKEKIEDIDEALKLVKISKIEAKVYEKFNKKDVIKQIKVDYDLPIIVKKIYNSKKINNHIELEEEIEKSEKIRVLNLNSYDQVIIGIIGNQTKQLLSKIAYIDSNLDKIVIPYNTTKEIEHKILDISRKIYITLNLEKYCLISFYIDNTNIYFDTITTENIFSKNDLLTTLFNYSNVTNKELLDILINVSIDNYVRRNI